MLRLCILLLPFFSLIVQLIFNPLAGLEKPEIALCAFMAAWMVLWWIFEVLPLGITALIPMVFLPMFGVLGIKEVSAYYSNSVIYLFLGGFIIARALEKTGLSERIALLILSRTASSVNGIILGFVLATSFLSMWISNTATTVMMVPIGISVINFIRSQKPESEHHHIDKMAIALFLGIAYSANIGGFTTPVGTPPNVVFIGFLQDMLKIKVDFYKWMLVSVPVAIVMLVFMTLVLARLYPSKISIDDSFKSFVKGKVRALGKISKEQKLTLVIFTGVCLLWIFKDLIHQLLGREFLNDTSVAILGGVLLFTIPIDYKRYHTILGSSDISGLPWNIVLLFGGGMALTGSLEKVGLLAEMEGFFSLIPFSSMFLLALVITVVALWLTELMSNVALCMVLLPVVMSFAGAKGMDPFILAFPITIASSLAFSMPVATPPNAIVFATNYIKLKHMLVAGVIMNFLGLAVLMSLGWYLLNLVFG